MSLLDNKSYLVDIYEAAKDAVNFMEGIDQEAFLHDRKTQAAVNHCIMIIGEAVKRLSSDFKQGHGEIPWKKMAGMRDKLIHDYLDVDLNVVWGTVKEDLPSLIDSLEKVLQGMD